MSFLGRLPFKPALSAAGAWLGVAFVVYLISDLLLMPFVAGHFKEVVAVPNLVGKEPSLAQQQTEEIGLTYMLDSVADYSTFVPKGHILSQFPVPDTEVKRGRRIWVKVSKGFRRVEMPALRGLSLRQAEISLQQIGLEIGKIERHRNASIPKGAVIGTSPEEGVLLEKNDQVLIRLSEGRRGKTEVIPDFSGLSLPQAKRQIKELNLRLGSVLTMTQTETLPNTVIRQKPAPGNALEGQTVHLVVSEQ